MIQGERNIVFYSEVVILSYINPKISIKNTSKFKRLSPNNLFYYFSCKTMVTMKVDEDQLNQLVVKYLGQVNIKLRDKFCKAANIQPELSEGEGSGLCLETLVQSYLESQSEKRKCPESEESEEATKKKPKLDEKTPSVAKKAKQKKMDRKTVFIRNIGKKFNFEKHRGRFEAFGQTHGFTNSGKGFAFVTFQTEEAATTCIETLNNTEIDGQTVMMNIARGHQGKGVSV